MSQKRPSRLDKYISWLPNSPTAMAKAFRDAADEKERAKLTGTVVKGYYWVTESSTCTPSDRRRATALAESLLLAVTKDPPTPRRTRWNSWELPEDIHTAWTWFEFNPSEKFAAQVTRFVRGRDRRVHAFVFNVLGRMGFDSAIPALVKGTKSPHADVIAALAAGVNDDRSHAKQSAKFRTQLFHALAPIAAGERPLKGTPEELSNCCQACHAAIWSLDPHAAMSLLASPRCLRPDHPDIRSVLMSLQMMRDGEFEFRPPMRRVGRSERRMKVRVEPPTIEPLWLCYGAMLKHARRRRNDWPWIHTMLMILGFAADVDPARSLRELEALLKVVDTTYTSVEAADITKAATRAAKRLGIRLNA